MFMSITPVTRLDKLTSLRFFAALPGRAFHLRTQPPSAGSVLHLYVQSLRLVHGVSVFYVLSGFVISLANERWKGGEGTAGEVTRIYPSHWIVTLALILGGSSCGNHLYLMSSGA